MNPSLTDLAPVISIIIPARNCPGTLRQCLESVKKSAYAEFEVIVVDDASTDATAAVAGSLGARCISLEQQSGPARARNRGAEAARGQYLLFLDADVGLHDDAMGLMVAAFQQDSTIDAIFGSYDRQPQDPHLISQYRNLFHHFVHQNGPEEASTFWSGCGAIKRSAFTAIGGFDTSYGRPCVEDIELGARLSKAGHRIVIHKGVFGKHLKRWTLWGMVRGDVADRAIPWTRLLLQERVVPNELNLKWSQRCTLILALALLTLFIRAAIFEPRLWLIPIAGVLTYLTLDWCTGYRRLSGAAKIGALFVFGAGGTLIAEYRPHGLSQAIGIAVIVALLNARMYRFFVRERGILFAVFVAPLHLLYFFYSAFGLAVGIFGHYWHLAMLRLYGHEAFAVREPRA